MRVWKDMEDEDRDDDFGFENDVKIMNVCFIGEDVLKTVLWILRWVLKDLVDLWWSLWVVSFIT